MNDATPSALVTGGAGFIGSHVARTLLAHGWRVEVLDDLSAGDARNVPAGAALRMGDVRSEDDVRAVFQRAMFDAVIHCAAQTSVPRSMREPEFDWEVNVAGTRRLAAHAQAAGARRFVFLSSGGAIYGETKTPAREGTKPSPRSHYGRHKLEAEQALRESSLPAVILRPSNVYGPGQRADAEGGVIAIFIQRLLAGEPLEIQGSGRQLRDFVHVSDVTAAVVAALAGDESVTWNVASGEATMVLDLAALLSELLDRPPELLYAPRRAGDIDRSLLSPAALLRTGRWGPPIPLRRGLELTLKPVVTAVLGASLPEPSAAANLDARRPRRHS